MPITSKIRSQVWKTRRHRTTSRCHRLWVRPRWGRMLIDIWFAINLRPRRGRKGVHYLFGERQFKMPGHEGTEISFFIF